VSLVSGKKTPPVLAPSGRKSPKSPRESRSCCSTATISLSWVARPQLCCFVQGRTISNTRSSVNQLVDVGMDVYVAAVAAASTSTCVAGVVILAQGKPLLLGNRTRRLATWIIEADS
jgi:hypothetical protein